MDYLHNDDAIVVSPVIEVPDSPPPKKKAKSSAPAKRTRASMTAPTQAALPPSPKVHLVEHAKVFAMAVKYHVHALRNLAAQKFKNEVADHWDHEDLAHAIHDIHTSTTDGVIQLREVTVEALVARRGLLLGKPEIAALLRSIIGLACDLLMRSNNQTKSGNPDEVVDDVRTDLAVAMPNQLDVDSATKTSKHARVVPVIATTIRVALLYGGDAQSVEGWPELWAAAC